jgi:hypothetical protein
MVWPFDCIYPPLSSVNRFLFRGSNMSFRTRSPLALVCLVAILVLVLGFVACGGAGGGSSNNTTGVMPPGTMNTFLSDPPTCLAPKGPYSHVYVTVTDVRIHQSSTADPSTSGWIDLAPGLASAPKQVDLLGQASTQCFLAQLGVNTQLPAGNYQQVRIILAPNNGSVSGVTNNQCGSNVFNCVVLASDNSIHTILLSSEAITGIKIAPGQIAGGGLNVPSGQTVDLDIDFDACTSLVPLGNGQYRLKPTLGAGEVSVNSSSITGSIIDSKTTLAIVGGTTIVALERKDVNGVDRVVMQTLADSQGNFVFCPVVTGTYDVVAVAIDGAGVAYAATVTSGVMQGTAMGKIPLIAETGTNTTQASITGTVTTANAVPAGTVADVTLSALQPLTIGGSSVLVTIPLVMQSSSTVNVSTASGASCDSNTDCVGYTLSVPAANPSLGAFVSGGTTYAQDMVSPVAYTVDGQAFVPLSGATPDCTPPVVEKNTLMGGGNLVVTAGGSVTAATLAFTGCN